MYSIGYRIDLQRWKIVSTGGIYIRSFPSANEVTIDSKKTVKPGLFDSAVFVQDLLPGQHTVTVRKIGYFDYQKTLEVTGKQAEKIEDILLIKKDIPFSEIAQKADYLSLSDDGNRFFYAVFKPASIEANIISRNSEKHTMTVLLPAEIANITDLIWSGDSNKLLMKSQGKYYLLNPFEQKPKALPLPYLSSAKQISFDPRNSDDFFYVINKNLYSSKKSVPIIKNVASYYFADGGIVWLSYDSNIYNSDFSGKLISTLFEKPYSVNTANSYKLATSQENISLQENQKLFFLNKTTKLFEDFYSPIAKTSVSPDGKKLLYYNENEISYLTTKDGPAEKVLLARLQEKIIDCYWLNNDYLIFNTQNSIVISEIDPRGHINMHTLPQTLIAGGKEFSTKGAKIAFNRNDGKIYMLSGNTLIASEKITQ